MPRRRSHRAVFCLAGIYNLAWGLHAVMNPDALFRFAGMPPARYPEVWACLGMVIGLYGIVYLEIARTPEHGFVPAAVGLLGKVLGPLGWAVLVLSGRWPVTTVVLVVTNDFAWWYPFARYLRDAWPSFRQQLQHNRTTDVPSKPKAGKDPAENTSSGAPVTSCPLS